MATQYLQVKELNDALVHKISSLMQQAATVEDVREKLKITVGLAEDKQLEVREMLSGA